MSHPFERYLQRRGHYPRARLPIGGDAKIEVYVTPSYAVFSRIPYGRPIAVPRNELVALLKWLTPLVRQMDSSFSVESAIQGYAAQENLFLTEYRAQKRDRHGGRRSRRR